MTCPWSGLLVPELLVELVYLLPSPTLPMQIVVFLRLDTVSFVRRSLSLCSPHA